MSEKDKKVIVDFINYLENDSVKYEFKNGGWSYTNEIYDFISYCYDNDVVIKYDSIEERNKLQLIDINIMTNNDIGKYLYMLFNGERFSSGMIMNNIKNNKLLNTLKKLVSNQ